MDSPSTSPRPKLRLCWTSEERKPEKYSQRYSHIRTRSLPSPWHGVTAMSRCPTRTSNLAPSCPPRLQWHLKSQRGSSRHGCRSGNTVRTFSRQEGIEVDTKRGVLETMMWTQLLYNSGTWNALSGSLLAKLNAPYFDAVLATAGVKRTDAKPNMSQKRALNASRQPPLHIRFKVPRSRSWAARGSMRSAVCESHH